MHIVVCIKQVPETSNVKMDEKTGVMVRDGVESIVNPLDLYALELALALKEERGAEITVLSMGPRNADRAIREALAMGCDQGVLASDRAFAGSDTWATSYVLAKAIEKLAPFDLVFAGVRATDGDTSQVGPAIASFLDLPLCAYVSHLRALDERSVTVQRLVEQGYETLRLPLPAVLTVGKEIGYPRLPTLRGKQRAREAEIATWGPGDLAVQAESLGLAGSPTRVVKIEKPSAARECRMVALAGTGAPEAAREVVDFLEAHNLLSTNGEER